MNEDNQIIVDLNLIEKDLLPKRFYYLIYANSCPICKILIKYIPYMKTKFKLVNIYQINEIINEANMQNIKVPMIINSKMEKVCILSLVDYLLTHVTGI